MPDCDVLVLGDYYCDIIITGLPGIPRLGADLFGEAMEIAPGGAFILTTALHRLGVRARWLATLGDDLFSRFVYDEAQREGLDTSLFQMLAEPFRSMSLSFSFAHDRGFISYTDPRSWEPPRQLVDALRPAWVANAPFDGSAASLRFADAIHRHGGRMYTDCQYVTTTLDEPGLTGMLRKIDVFAPNLSEARQLTGAATAEEALARLAEYCPLVVVKCGADGAYARAGDRVWHCPAIPVEVVDTTGAGDSFNAGFLAATLQGQPLETCLRYGNICGGLSTTRRGGATAVPTLEQLRAWL